MEPISTTAVTLALWEQAVKPVVKSIEKEYGEAVKNELKKGVNKVLSKLSFNKNKIEVIEAEIVELEKEILMDEQKFSSFLADNKQISDSVIEVNSRNKNIKIKVDKGVGYIEEMNGDINF